MDPSTRSSESSTQAVVTRLALALALCLLGAAAYLLTSAPSPEQKAQTPSTASRGGPGPVSPSPKRTPAASLSAPSTPVPPGAALGANPLNIAAALLRAEGESHQWASNAELVSIRLFVEKGRPEGPLEFDYGQPIGPALPGASLTAERYTVRIEGAQLSRERSRAEVPGIAVADPNCPLEAAYRAAKLAGLPEDQKSAALYSYAARHARPLWTFSVASGKAILVDGERCTILTRASSL